MCNNRECYALFSVFVMAGPIVLSALFIMFLPHELLPLKILYPTIYGLWALLGMINMCVFKDKYKKIKVHDC